MFPRCRRTATGGAGVGEEMLVAPDRLGPAESFAVRSTSRLIVTSAFHTTPQRTKLLQHQILTSRLNACMPISRFSFSERLRGELKTFFSHWRNSSRSWATEHAAMMNVEDGSNMTCTPEGTREEVWKAAQMELDTWKSEVSCALNIADMLEPYVDETRNLGNPAGGTVPGPASGERRPGGSAQGSRRSLSTQRSECRHARRGRGHEQRNSTVLGWSQSCGMPP